MDGEESGQELPRNQRPAQQAIKKRTGARKPASVTSMYNTARKIAFLPEKGSSAITTSNLLKIITRDPSFFYIKIPPYPTQAPKITVPWTKQILHEVYIEIIVSTYLKCPFHLELADKNYYIRAIYHLRPNVFHRLQESKFGIHLKIDTTPVAIVPAREANRFGFLITSTNNRTREISERVSKNTLEKFQDQKMIRVKLDTKLESSKKIVSKMFAKACSAIQTSQGLERVFLKNLENLKVSFSKKIFKSTGRKKEVFEELYTFYQEKIKNADLEVFMYETLHESVTSQDVAAVFREAENRKVIETRRDEVIEAVSSDKAVCKKLGEYSTYNFPRNVVGQLMIWKELFGEKKFAQLPVTPPEELTNELRSVATILISKAVEQNTNGGVKILLKTYGMIFRGSNDRENLRLLGVLMTKLIVTKKNSLKFKDPEDFLKDGFFFHADFKSYQKAKKTELQEELFRNAGTFSNLSSVLSLYIHQLAGVYYVGQLLPALKTVEITSMQCDLFSKLLLPDPENRFNFENFVNLFFSMSPVIFNPEFTVAVEQKTTPYNITQLLDAMAMDPAAGRKHLEKVDRTEKWHKELLQLVNISTNEQHVLYPVVPGVELRKHFHQKTPLSRDNLRTWISAVVLSRTLALTFYTKGMFYLMKLFNVFLSHTPPDNTFFSILTEFMHTGMTCLIDKTPKLFYYFCKVLHTKVNIPDEKMDYHAHKNNWLVFYFVDSSNHLAHPFLSKLNHTSYSSYEIAMAASHASITRESNGFAKFAALKERNGEFAVETFEPLRPAPVHQFEQLFAPQRPVNPVDVISQTPSFLSSKPNYFQPFGDAKKNMDAAFVAKQRESAMLREQNPQVQTENDFMEEFGSPFDKDDLNNEATNPTFYNRADQTFAQNANKEWLIFGSQFSREEVDRQKQPKLTQTGHFETQTQANQRFRNFLAENNLEAHGTGYRVKKTFRNELNPHRN